MNKIFITAVICLIIAGAGGYFIGKSNSSTAGGLSADTQKGQGRFNGTGGRGQGVRGKVINSDANTITVQGNDGSSTIVVLSGSTMYYKSSPSSKTDVNTGDTVMIFGPKNSDGSVTAQMVQLNPIIRSLSGSPTPSQ